VVTHRTGILGLTNVLLFMINGRLEKWGQRSEVLAYLEEESQRRKAAAQASNDQPALAATSSASADSAEDSSNE